MYEDEKLIDYDFVFIILNKFIKFLGVKLQKLNLRIISIIMQWF